MNKIEFTLTHEQMAELKTATAPISANSLLVNATNDGVSFNIYDQQSYEGTVKFPIISDGTGNFTISKNMLNSIFSVMGAKTTFTVDDTLLTVDIDGTKLNINLPYDQDSGAYIPPMEGAELVAEIPKDRFQQIINLMNVSNDSDAGASKIIEFAETSKSGNGLQVNIVETPEFAEVKIPLTGLFYGIAKMFATLTKDNVSVYLNKEAGVVIFTTSYTTYWSALNQYDFPTDYIEGDKQEETESFTLKNVNPIVSSLKKLSIPLIGISNPFISLKTMKDGRLNLSVTDLGNRISHAFADIEMHTELDDELVQISIKSMSSILSKCPSEDIEVSFRETLVKFRFDGYSAYLGKFL